jgi:ribosome-associated heat shock protein Hsp15
MALGCTFFKTRSIAKAAIEGGKVHHNNERVKVSKEIRVGMELTIMQGFEKKTVVLKHSQQHVVLRLWLNYYMKKQRSV